MENSEKPQQGTCCSASETWRLLVMSRLDKPADFSALLEKYADSALLPRGGWNAGRGRSDSVPSRNEVIRERLSDRFRSTYHDRTRSYALRESEIFALVELGKFRVISTDDLSRFAYDGVKDRLEQDLQNLKKTAPYLATRNRARSNSKFWVLSLTIVESLTFERHPNNLVKTAVHAGRGQVRLPKGGKCSALPDARGTRRLRSLLTENARPVKH
jgi:hypothetical protein